MAQRYYGRKRAYKSFSAEVDDIIATVDARMTALMRQSLQDVINNAQTPTAKGGRMRVDTGFLRASGQASLTGMPSGPARGESKVKGAYKSEADYANTASVTVSLTKLKVGASFYFGWTANYARYRELYDGFLEGALNQWHRIVAFNADTLRKQIK